MHGRDYWWSGCCFWVSPLPRSWEHSESVRSASFSWRSRGHLGRQEVYHLCWNLDKATLHTIEIGGGLISSVDESEDLTDSENSIPGLPWSRANDSVHLRKPFHIRSKALIGTTTVNTQCPMDEHQSWPHANEQMETLRAEESYWKVSEAQAGIQGGLYAVAMFNITWVKQPGTTLKNIYLGGNTPLPFLQSDWGLQISFCTGAARRVSLCNLLADVTPIHMDALVQKLHGWNSLQMAHQMADAFRREDLRSWFDGLNLELVNHFTRIICYVLLIFQDTGIDHSNEYLVVAWPRAINPFGCFKISCKKTSFWARMLADSGHCAAFAYVTPLCLETDKCKCQNQETARWKSTSAVLILLSLSSSIMGGYLRLVWIVGIETRRELPHRQAGNVSAWESGNFDVANYGSRSGSPLYLDEQDTTTISTKSTGPNSRKIMHKYTGAASSRLGNALMFFFADSLGTWWLMVWVFRLSWSSFG